MLISLFLLMYLMPGIQEQHQLDVEITGLRNDNGSILIQLMDENEKTVHQEMLPIREKTSKYLFKDLVPGKYAIRYFHDENGNGAIDTSAIGRPLEGYGFSNNVPAKFGPPPFDKWLFVLDEDKKLKLSIIY